MTKQDSSSSGFLRRLDATERALRRVLGWFFGMRDLPTPSLSEETAIAIAQAYSVQEGWGEIENPCGVWTAARASDPEQWEIRSFNPKGLGGGTRIVVDCRQGTVLGGGRIRR